jgi:hypothetical protein
MTLSRHGHAAKISRAQTHMLEIGQISCFEGSFFFSEHDVTKLAQNSECFHRLVHQTEYSASLLFFSWQQVDGMILFCSSNIALYGV